QHKLSRTDSELLMKFINSVSIRNQNTAKAYHSRLLFFARFAKEKYGLIFDEIIQKLKDREYDPYDILNNYCLFLKNNYNSSSTAFKDKIITVKTFLEYNDIELSPKKFKLKVIYPKTIFRHKEAIDKEDIVKILNGCSDLRLKTYVMLLASTGLRATEALSIRIKDLDINSNDSLSKAIIRGEYTKTKVDRHVFLTREIQHQLKIWLDFKYRRRRICHIDKETGKSISEYRTPEKKLHDLIFSINPIDKARPEILYFNLAHTFSNTLDRIGMGDREDENQLRRKITLHSFRRFVKSTISDLGYSDYSEWFIGHLGSTYWRKKDNEKAEIFQKIEPYLTFLNIQQLKRQGADLETKIEELKDVNQVLREKDKMKEDVIANLSDKLIMLSERLDAIEKLNRD
ncbi:MAG: tyrosine-type recombinase/integrase, partial [Nitrososphaeraceae archaeon]